MTRLLTLLLLCSPASALDFDSPVPGGPPVLSAWRSDPQVLGKVPFRELQARRDGAALPAGRALLTPAFDSAWNTFLSVRLPGSPAPVCAWKEAELSDGVSCPAAGLSVKEEAGRWKVSWEGGSTETGMGELFDRLYDGSPAVTFQGLVTYALVRNLEPGTGKEGTVTLRVGSDGLYYYSLTQDETIREAPRWLLAINGVLYGLRADAADLLFLSKVIDDMPKLLRGERAGPRAPRR